MKQTPHAAEWISGWLLAGALVFGPWALGCTTPDTEMGLIGIIAAAGIWWAARCGLALRWPQLPLYVLVPMVWLAAQGTWMVWNAHSIYLRELWECWPLEPPLPALPGTMDLESSRALVPRALALLTAFALALELGKDERWRRRLSWAIVIAGVSIAGLGLLERMLQAPSILWMGNRIVGNFFGTYRSVTNASAYLNFVWPVIGGLLFINIRRHGSRLIRAFLLVAWIITLTAALLTGSRGGSLLTLLLVGSFFWMHHRFLMSHLNSQSRVVWSVAAVLIAAVMVLLALLAGLVAHDRWAIWSGGDLQSLHARWAVTVVNIRAAWAAGPAGFGPGTFHLVFPHFTGELGPILRGVWEHAHQDYLQWIIEWGWLGGLAWGWLFFVGPCRAWQNLRRDGMQWPVQDRMWVRSLLVAWAGMAVMAAVDFPLQVPSLALCAWVAAGLLWSWADASPPASESKEKSRLN